MRDVKLWYPFDSVLPKENREIIMRSFKEMPKGMFRDRTVFRKTTLITLQLLGDSEKYTHWAYV